jgi:hypothetical protein
VELPAPWDRRVEFSNAFPSELRELIQRLESEGDRLRLQCVLPDPDYSSVGMTRLMLFSRPQGALVTNDRVEYLVPDELVAQVAASLLGQGNDPAAFASFKEPDRAVRDILVCTHGNRDACCGTFGVPVYEALRQMVCESEMGDGPPVRVWRTSHTGGHRFAPTLIDMPDGRYWAGVEADLAGEILRPEGPVAAIASHYRGWAALETCAEQNAEAAAFMRVGWDWLACEKQVETVGHDPALDLHTVRFDYRPDGKEARSFEVTVEFTGTVPTMNCMKEGSKGENSQYRVIA